MNSDLQKTNDAVLKRRAKREQRFAAYRERTTKARNRRRQVDLIVAGVTRGWLR